jgi:hypothetical protein
VLSGQQDRTVSAEVTAGLLAALDAGKSRVEHVALAGVGQRRIWRTRRPTPRPLGTICGGSEP